MQGFAILLPRFILPCLLVNYLIGCNINLPSTDPSSPSDRTTSNLPPITTPFVYEVPDKQTNWGSYNGTYIYDKVIGPTSGQESNSLQIEIRRDYGASLQIYDKVTKQQLINFKDLGRESGMCSYGGPISFSDDSPNWKGIGYNPLQAGDDGGNPSPILFHGNINGWMYTKAQCLSWAHKDARKLPFFYEQWVRLDGNKVYVKVRLTHQRPDKTFYEPRSQEWPFMLVNGARKIHFYNGTNPFTYDKTTVTDGFESDSTRNVVYRGLSFGITEPWQALEIGPNRFIGLYTPGFFLANYNVDNVAANESWEGGNTVTYAGNNPLAHLDSDNTWYKEYTYIIGTEQEIRDFVYAQERSPKPDFFFNAFNGRSGWVVFNGGYDQKEPFTSDNWQVTLTGKDQNAYHAKLMSPYGSWKASDFNTIYLRMAYTGAPGAGAQVPLRLTWLLNGQAPDGTDPSAPNQSKVRFPNGVRNINEQTLPLSVINDGQFHTYKISFANQPKWNGIVQQFEIGHPFSPTNVTPGEKLVLNYFGVRNPGE